MKIARSMKNTPNLHAFCKRSVKDQIVSKTLHPPGAQALMTKLSPCPPHERVYRQELKAIIGRLQESTCQHLIIHSQPTEDGLQIAEHILAFLETRRHHPPVTMRSMVDRSPILNRPSAASSSRSWMRGGVSASSAIHLSSACLATSSLSRYPSAIWRWIKASMGPVIVISMTANLRPHIPPVNSAAPFN